MKLTENAQAPVYWIKQDPHAGNDDAGTGESAGGEGEAAGAGVGDLSLAAGAGGGEGGGGEELQIPEKFLVKLENGEIDHKATALKQAGSYKELEGRIGTIGFPPKSVDEYKLEPYLPEGLEAIPEKELATLGKFHELGLTNKQAQGVMSMFGETLNQGLEAQKASKAQAATELKEGWGESYNQNMEQVGKAIQYLPISKEDKAALKDSVRGNDPVVLRLLAAVGADLSEDRLTQELTPTEANNIEQLRTSKAYLDANDPDHKRVVGLVNAAYSKGYKAA